MKKIYFLFFISMFSVNSHAYNLADYALASYVTGLCLVPVFDNIWHKPTPYSHGLHVSPGIDPRMAIDGQLNYRLKIYYHHKRFEGSVIHEVFAANYYHSLSLGVDYMFIKRKLSLLIGPEITRIWNRNPHTLHTAIGYGINTELRYHLTKRISLSYIANIETRPEISDKTKYNGYVHINF